MKKDEAKSKEELIAELQALRDRVNELEKIVITHNDELIKVDIQGLEVAWQPSNGVINVAGLPALLIWINSSLAGLMKGFQAMVGTERFSLALHGISREGTEDDWSFISQHPNFEAGFAAIRHIAALSGWGDWQLVSVDLEKQTFCVRVINNWEGICQKALGVNWGSSMLAGKLAGYGSKLFETNCWANQTASIADGGEYDEFIIQPSTTTVEQELDHLMEAGQATSVDLAVAMEKLKKEAAERKETARQLERLVTLIEYSNDFIGFANLEGQAIFLNKGGQEMVGLAADEVQQSYVIDHLPTDIHPFVINEVIPTVLKTGRWVGEVNFQHFKTKELIPVLWDVFRLDDPETGQPSHIATVTRDISELKRAELERERLQQEIIEAQQQAIQELSTPVIPVMSGIIVMPLVGNIDSRRTQDLMRTLLAGIGEHRAKVVILDITGVPMIDTGIAGHLDKTIQAARLKGARTIITGISDAVAETFVDLGIDWSQVETLRDLQTGLVVALESLGIELTIKQ